MKNILNEKILSVADLLPDEYATCVRDALRDSIVGWFHNLSNDDKARIISNMSYQMMYDIIKDEMPDVGETIKNSVIEKINDKSGYGYYVFGYDSVSRPKVGQEIVDRTVKENIATVRQNTLDSISQMSKKDIKEFMVKYQYRQID